MGKKNEWFEVVGVFKKDEGMPKDIEGNQVYIRGELNDMMIIQVPTGVDHNVILQGIQRMMDKEGIEKGVFVINDDIEFMKLEAVEGNKAKVMEAKYQEVRMHRLSNATTTKVMQ